MGEAHVVEDISMIPVLYDKTETTYKTWGLGLIKDAQSAIVTEELGGEFTAEVVLPSTSQAYPELEVDRIIVLWVPYRRYHRTAPLTGNRDEGGKQPFRITSISKPMKGMVTVKCEHVSAQTKRIIMKRREKWDGVHYNYQYCNDLPRAGSNPFSMDITEIKGDKPYIDNIVPVVKIPMSMRDYLQGKEGSITDVCRCDWIYNKWNITAVKKRGTEANMVVRYGLNLTDIKQDEEIAAVRTAIYPYYYKEENGVVTYVAPDTYVRCQYADNYPYDRIEIWDCTQEFDTVPTAQDLTDWAAAYMERNDWGVPNVSITINPVTQAGSLGYDVHAMMTPEYEADQELFLGDTVKVVFEKLGIDTEARVTKYEFDSIKERYRKIDVGTIKPSITKSLAAVFKKTGVKIR